MTNEHQPPTLGELTRTLDRTIKSFQSELGQLRASINDLSGKVLTEAVWQREREYIERQIKEVQKDIHEQEKELEKFKEADAKEKQREEAEKKSTQRFWIGGLAIPLVLTFIIAVASLAWQFITISQGLAAP